jgi:hypothetical protein
MGKPLNILIGHLTSNGDILYSSAIARQIKEIDFPGCHLTWAVSTGCAKILYQNPYIDKLWEVPIENGDVVGTWKKLCEGANKKKEAGLYDEVFLVQLVGDNLLHYNKTIRLSVLAGYSKPLAVPLEPTIRLHDTEIRNVSSFTLEKKLADYKKVVLFECAPLSGQSVVSPEFALKVLKIVNQKLSGVCFILSSNVAIESDADNIINASELSLRENAELSKYCDLLIGCSSGITWLLTSDWAKPLPTIQFLNKKAVWFNSVVKDYEVRDKKADHVLELYHFDEQYAAICILDALTSDFDKARKKHHQQYNRYWCSTETSILFSQLKSLRIINFIKFSFRTAKNNNVLFLMIAWMKVICKCFTSMWNRR